MGSIKATDNQSLFDLAIQKLGSCEAVFELALLNGLSVTDELAPGQNILLSAIADNKIAGYYYKKGIAPATYGGDFKPHEGIIEVIYWSNDIQQIITGAKVADGQSLFDVSIQKLGSCEAAFELALLNGLSITDELVPGQSLLLPNAWDPDILNYYTNKAIAPKTATSVEETAIVNEGIGYWAIEVDFIVS